MPDGKPATDFKCQGCGAEFAFTDFVPPVCLNCESTYLTFHLKQAGPTRRTTAPE